MNTVSMKAAIIMAALFSSGAWVSVAHADELSVEERVDKLERMVNSRNLVQIEMQQQVDALSNEVRQLRGSLEEANYKLQQATERQKALYQELDQVKSNAAAASATAASSAQASTPIVGAGTAQAATPSTPSAPVTADEKQAYDAAVNLVMKDKSYDKAIPAFEAFIKQHPQSSLVPNAHYWLGQLQYNQGDKESAKANFLTVAQKYKESPKRADALLKLGMITLSEGDKEKAGKFFQLVMKQYPDSPSAQLAQKALNTK
ncbi:MAG: tol-pal system protein YbgF [Aeromonadaceae bacterium]